MRALVIVIAVMAVSVGVWLRPAPHAVVAADPAAGIAAASAWAEANGLVLRRTDSLTNVDNYAVHRFAGPNRCILSVAPLGSADEVLSLLHEIVEPADWERSRLLVVHTHAMPQAAFGVHARLLLARLVEGRAPQPVMLIGPSACLTEPFLARVTSWPTM